MQKMPSFPYLLFIINTCKLESYYTVHVCMHGMMYFFDNNLDKSRVLSIVF